MNRPLPDAVVETPGPLDISDEDVLTAMREIGGYIDITAGDFKALYRIAHRQALKRLMGAVRAGDLMTREVVFVERTTPLARVAETMAHHTISGVPVVEREGSVAGMLSEKDFLRQMLPEGSGSFIGLIAECLRAKGCLALPIRKQNAGDIMNAPAITVVEATSLAEIIRLFREQRINRVPVLNEQGRLVGIVTRADVLRSLVSLTAGEL
jgi:CBS domain-containing membrane protein